MISPQHLKEARELVSQLAGRFAEVLPRVEIHGESVVMSEEDCDLLIDAMDAYVEQYFVRKAGPELRRILQRKSEPGR